MMAWAGIELVAAPTTRRNAETTNNLFIKLLLEPGAALPLQEELKIALTTRSTRKPLRRKARSSATRACQPAAVSTSPPGLGLMVNPTLN
jgi:hypothetical protein